MLIFVAMLQPYLHGGIRAENVLIGPKGGATPKPVAKSPRHLLRQLQAHRLRVRQRSGKSSGSFLGDQLQEHGVKRQVKGAGTRNFKTVMEEWRNAGTDLVTKQVIASQEYVGTSNFMAPEANNGRIGEKCDCPT